MSTQFLSGFASLLVVSVFVAGCGGDDTSSSTTSSSSGGDTSFPESNGCDPAAAEDHSADTTDVVVNFGANAGNQLLYLPACVSISAGQNIAFKGNFVGHFLTGGLATSSSLTADASSPIPTTKDGSEVIVAFPTAGTYPYYCEQHGKIGMKGAVFVK